MATIEERAKEYANMSWLSALVPHSALNEAYIKGATEQKQIDNDKACALDALMQVAKSKKLRVYQVMELFQRAMIGDWVHDIDEGNNFQIE